MFADIIVDISIESLDRTYQYRIPESMEQEIQIGSAVMIPFGKGNRQIRGFVLDITEKSKFPIDRTKDITSVIKDSVVIESQLLALAGYIRENYGSTMNEALKTVLPIKKQIKSVQTHWLSCHVQGEELAAYIALCEKRHYKAKLRLLHAIREQGGRLDSKVAANKYKITKAVIDGLVNEGIIDRESKQIYRNPLEQMKLEENRDITMNENQRDCVNRFIQDYQQKNYQTYLLHGVTGSGKTEVYIRMMEQVIKGGRQGIILIPEIALTHQTVARFYQHFGKQVSILNSRMSEGERYDQYTQAREGEIKLVIGPRSALFMPFEDIGLIIIDEEHENSYKSENTPKYHAREVAIYRAKLAHASVVLGSATPSVEAYYRATTGEYQLLEMKNRAGEGTLPHIHVEDLREEMKAKNHSIFSRRLQGMIKQRLDEHQQVMLFLNRRGFAGFVSCRSCGNVLKCPHCDISYTAHKNFHGEVDTLTCHYCGHHIPMPDKCPKCGSPYIAGFGLGTQKVEALTKKMFPQARVLRMDADTTTGKNGHENILRAFRQGEADILIGTQMIVKGHDFPQVTLVGILAADLSMFAGDYRSGERTFQLLMQASGRAGRGSLPGDVVIQTYDPEHYAIQAVKNQDYIQFYENEMAYRRMMHYPPVWSIMAVLSFSKDEKMAEGAIGYLADFVKNQKLEGVQCIGPTKANIGKINDWYRYVCYVKCDQAKRLTQIQRELEVQIDERINQSIVSVGFDRNPMNGY